MAHATTAPGRPFETAALARASACSPGLAPARWLLRRSLAGVFGTPRLRDGEDADEPGLTGPRAASWWVLGDPSSIVGGLRALLLQVSHPLAMAGVYDHSAFRDDPLGRLQRTSAWVTIGTYGTSREALAVTRRVRAVHRGVRGVAPDGRPYRAGDPDLLVWVSVTLTHSLLVAQRRWAPRPVPGEVADRFVTEQSRLAALLDPRVDLEALEHDPAATGEALRAGRLDLPLLCEERLPTDVGGLEATLASFEPELAVNHQGREALRFLRWPPLTPHLRAAYLVLLGGAAASLSRAQRWRLRLPLPAPRRVAVTNTAALLATMRAVAGRSAAAERADDATAPARP